MFIFGLLVQKCLAENAETAKHEHGTDKSDKKVSKREHYAPEYNHDQYVSVNNNINLTHK